MDASMTQHEILLRRLRENAERNLRVFANAGIPEDRVHNLRCRCGCWERAYFWTIERQQGSTIHLSCPSCNGRPVRYDTAGNRIARSRLSRTARDLGLTGLVVTALVAGAFLHDPAYVLRLVDAAELRARQQLSRNWAELTTPTGGSALLASTPSARAGLGSARLAAGSAVATRLGREIRNTIVFVSDGDRRDEVVALAEQAGVPADTARPDATVRADTTTNSVTVEYVEELGITRVVMTSDSSALRLALREEEGWRRLG